ncbi:(2Fe-2S)-binding protein [Streptomyces albidoflavus]|uniref:(2Fe-2S)-binding protein n=1 Tax=Streptomyces albidoflavus TaxID=1886 RepID=UPI002E35A7B8|nr:(2Fe-2S)-binding protein [Streptomyces albidoflavus]WTC36857.1 (2Fe-2S)-binding protein [Streptomyces albidoflavus]WTC42635.1 (2Fe-2S)-binding protein [Streptomyces albidoflavus]WTD42944.1 (2Fe-2S)-binding protein [Streptomyces albidoflavus]WTD82783.1 (2Fe-2S)-binding protein [Streptomyces albidoflavus]
MTTSLAPLLTRLAAVGPYFAADPTPRADPSEGGFRPVAEWYGDGIAGHVEEIGRRMGTGAGRVAASTAQLGLASRLWSVALGCAALGGVVPDLGPGRLWWRGPSAGPVELRLPAPRPLPGPLPEALHRAVAVDHLAPLDEAVRGRYGLSPQILRGNAASALVGAVRVLLDRVPDAPCPPVPLVEHLLARAPLEGTGTFLHEEGLGVAFTRRSCCLYYRVPAATCGDCVLRTRPPGRSA